MHSERCDEVPLTAIQHGHSNRLRRHTSRQLDYIMVDAHTVGAQET